MSEVMLTCDLNEVEYYRERNLTLLRENDMLREKLADQKADYSTGNEISAQYREVLESRVAKLEEENAKLKKFREDIITVVVG